MVRLADIRKEKNLTQVEVAERSGLSEQTILKAEAGLHVPGLDTLRALCAVLGAEVFEAEYGWKKVEKPRGRPRKVITATTSKKEAKGGE